MTSQTLNPLTLPLSGMSLIEASAGTGKTYNMAALYTRLVLVENHTIERILVVTFTKAATAELKTRLRDWLGQALAHLQHEANTDIEAIIPGIVEKAQALYNDDTLIARLKVAIHQFDAAAIYTIHGFCQRVLTDYAFLCGVPFDTELGEADPLLLLTYAQDYWRQHISHHPQYAPLAAAHKLTPKSVLDELDKWLTRSDVTLCYPEQEDLASAMAYLQQTWSLLQSKISQIEQLFWQIKPIKIDGKKYRNASFTTLFNDLHQAIAENNPLFQGAHNDKLLHFEAAHLHQHTRKNQLISAEEAAILAPVAEFGLAQIAYRIAEQDTVLALKLNAFTHIRTQLNAQRKSSRRRSFNDLLADVGDALSGDHPQANTLAKALAQQWHIALIDEFQDTDPVQYRIFKTAFADQGRPLLMVGDPKQAIYRFRGADIHAYLQAAADTPPSQRYTLNTNYRSHTALVDGIGHLFQQKAHPFVLEGIPYPPIQANRSASRLSPNDAAIHIRWLHEHSDTTAPNKNLLRQRASQWCGDEVAATINQGMAASLNLNGQPLQAGDIAILVHTHKQASMVAESLKQRGIQSVLLNNQSIFAGEEALALLALLTFWLQPQQSQSLHYVLAGCLYGYRANDLDALNHDENALNQWLTWAQQAHECWQTHGIYSALQQFATASGMQTGLLRQRQYRSLTNFWQLAELMAMADTPTPERTLAWLQQHISQPPKQNETQQLRLESDEDLVKIITIHAAKGLEYPVVYCPFAWDVKNQSQDTWALLHDQGESHLIHKVLRSEEDNATLLADHLGEDLRLHYVALTRACEKLVLYAAYCSHTEYNAFAYLLTGQAHPSVAENQAFWQQQKKGPTATATLAAAWQQCIQSAPDHIFAWHQGAPAAAKVTEQAVPAIPYQAHELPKRTFTWLRHTSFTALSRHHHADEAIDSAPVIDRAEVLPGVADTEADDAQTTLIAFARGMNAGVCLHALLEATNFSQPAAAQQHQYQPILTRHGFGHTPVADILPMIDAVRHTPLWPQSTLAHIRPAQQRVEMGFMLHMHEFSLHQLQPWLAQPHIGLPQACVNASHSLDFATVRGFLNGFIDLVCQDNNGRIAIIDYKSNHLGQHLSDYHHDAMDAAMAEHHYYLQALIYAIAVARYLHQRQALPDTLSIRYLFLRGLNPDNANGLWQWDIATQDLAPWLSQPA